MTDTSKSRRVAKLAACLPVIALSFTTGASCDVPDVDVESQSQRQELTFEALPGQTTAIFDDTGTTCSIPTQGARIRCCPEGMAMIGAQLSQNVYKCAKISGGLTGKHADFGTQRQNMHSCPPGELMFGFHRGFIATGVAGSQDPEILLCARPNPAIDVGTEHVDTTTQGPSIAGGTMHICPLKDSNQNNIVNPGHQAMTGIYDAGGGRFNCGTAGRFACGHDLCRAGTKATSGCDSCATSICQADPFCCNNQWDALCVQEVNSICGRSCTPGL